MKTAPQLSFGKWLKKRRKALDLTQRELAEQIQCATVTIQKIEAEQRRPSKQIVKLLATCLGVVEADYPDFVRFARTGKPTSRLPFINHSNIPFLATPLIGRDKDIGSLCTCLINNDIRLLTLLGPPGVGKTSLAVQVSNEMMDGFDDGVYFIPLDTISDAQLVPAVIAQTLGVNRLGPSTYALRLKEYLRDKNLLLVIDNFEQVLEAAPFIAELSNACPWLYILITSRSPLSIRGEHRYYVAPLELPETQDTPGDPAELMRYSAIRLFVERARVVNPDFSLDLDNAGYVAEICALLDGLPLAIELVSVRTDFFSPQVLLEQIKGNEVLRVGGLRDVSERHRTLHQAIAWSYALLSPDQQLLLSILSVFNGGWTLEAVEKIAGDSLAIDVMAMLKALVDASLVVQQKYHSQQRLYLLETIRSYAIGRLGETGDESAIHQRHADYYLALAEAAEPNLRTDGQMVWLERLEVERGNFREALRWYLDHSGDIEKGMRLAGALGWFWNIRSYVSEGHYWLERSLYHSESCPSMARAKAVTMAGVNAFNQADLARARVLFEEGIALYRALGSQSDWYLALTLSGYCNVVMYLGDHDALKRASDEAYALFSQLNDPWGCGLTLCLVGEVHLLNHDYSRACYCYEEAVRLLRTTGDRWATGIALMDWGYTNSLMGDLAAARAYLEESVGLHQSLGERYIRSMTLSILAQVVQRQDDPNHAIELYNESLDLLRKMGIEEKISNVQYNLASFVHAQGHYQLAKSLYQECLEMFRKQGNNDGSAACMANLEAIG